MSDGPADVEELYSRKKVYDPTLSKKGKKGKGAVYVIRPVLRLFPTRIEGQIGEVRRAMAVVGHDEGAGSQLAGAFVRFLLAKRSGVSARWGQLRTAADAALVFDAKEASVITLSGWR